tara:strand:- start:262 stop:366 length:105 start_codon:yes stop_codon:yes gene_type:complete
MIEIILISISMLVLFVGVFILISKSDLEDIHDKS